MRYVYLFLLPIVFFSCVKHESPKSVISNVVEPFFYVCGGSGIFPVKLVERETKDSLWMITFSSSLYNEQNMFFCSYEDFAKLLIKKIETDGFISVDSTLFKKCKPIVKDATVDSLYQREGIKGVLKRYVSYSNTLTVPSLSVSTHEEKEYLIYLLYLHRIYCFMGPDPALAIYVYFDLTGKEEEYLRLLIE